MSYSEKEIFKIKRKASKKKKKSDDLLFQCKVGECEKDNFNLVKCNNISENWGCEDCNDVPVARLKLVAYNCRGFFLIYKRCELNLKCY